MRKSKKSKASVSSKRRSKKDNDKYWRQEIKMSILIILGRLTEQKEGDWK